MLQHKTLVTAGTVSKLGCLKHKICGKNSKLERQRETKSFLLQYHGYNLAFTLKAKF